MLNLICFFLRDSFFLLDILIGKFCVVKVNVIIVDLFNVLFFDIKMEDVISLVLIGVFLDNLFFFKVVNMWLVEINFLLNKFDVIEKV